MNSDGIADVTAFDAEGERLPPALDALFSRAAEPPPVLLLVAGESALVDGWAGSAAISLARRWAVHRDGVLLIDLVLNDSSLQYSLGMRQVEGLSDVFEFGASLGHVAAEVPGEEFRYVAAGPYIPSPETLLGHPIWERIIAGTVEEGEALLVFASAGSPNLNSLAQRIGRAVILAFPSEAGSVRGELEGACEPILMLSRPGPPDDSREMDPEPESRTARLRPLPEDEPPVTPQVDPVTADPVTSEQLLKEPAFIQREEEAPARRRASPVLWIALVLALLGAGLLGLLELLASRSATPPIAEQALTNDVPPAPSRAIEEPLPFSVLIESYNALASASDRVDALRRAQPAIAFFVAPALYDTVVYYRVSAGPAADSASAEALLDRLVAEGFKTDRDIGAVRPTPWAFKIGDYETAELAEVRAEELRDLGIGTYAVEIPFTAGPSRIRLYTGAFEGSAQAEIMSRMLIESGIVAPLVPRTGHPLR